MTMASPAKPRVVLYNPQAVFFTMPLALIALGSALDRSRYDVVIIDGRLEADPVSAVLDAIESADTVCLGVSVLTGAPIRDALRITQAVKRRRPRLPVVWGGWHPSLFPEQTLAAAGIDAAVVGQGEATLVEIVERLVAGDGLLGVAGTVTPGDEGVVRGATRPMTDINALPPHDYSLVPVERYFGLKQRRQIDYISSQGCRFRCTFCADPYVYNRGWFGFEPERIGEELSVLAGRHQMEDVGFQDETFFTSVKRVSAIADQFLTRDLRFTWTATMRADQGARIDDQVLALAHRAGLRRVMVGVEAGTQALLDWMKKDIKLEQVYETAEKCRRAGVSVIFNLIVGFPDEPPESVTESMRVAKRLRAMSPDFEVAIFYYKPYPGNEIADMLVAQGYRYPDTLDGWADFEFVTAASPWVLPATRRRVDRFKFYQRIAWARPTALRAPVQALARWRCAHDVYTFPIEQRLVEWLRPGPRLS
jgi:radical SAM superfamily enzyme YgiQ (UPF0313 family)